MIWWLEGETTTLSSTNIFRGLLLTEFGMTGASFSNPNWVATIEANYTGSNVKVMNLTSVVKTVDKYGNITYTTVYNQDELVYVPGVPDEGCTVALLGLGLLGLTMIRRRLRHA